MKASGARAEDSFSSRGSKLPDSHHVAIGIVAILFVHDEEVRANSIRDGERETPGGKATVVMPRNVNVSMN